MSVDDVSKRERTISGALALAMHVLFIVLLVVGISWQPKRTAAPIAVELWSELPPAPRAKPEPRPPAPEAPKPPPRPEPRPEPKPEVKPVPKPDIALKEQLLKKKLQEEKAREREEKERQEKLVQEKLERERKLKAEEAKKRREKELAEEKRREEAKKIAEQKKREEEKRLAALKQQEEAKRREQELQAMLRKQAAEGEARSRLDAYSRLVADRIKRYIVEPPNMQGKPEAVFEVVQIPGGEILSVRLKRSSGNAAYDAAAERAIRKAQPLPPPPDPARFSEVRELELRVRPEDR